MEDTKKGAKMLMKMIRKICIGFVITFFACVLCVVILSYAYGEEVPNFATWEKVLIHEGRFDTRVVLKNPNPSDVTFAIITINNFDTIIKYVLVSRTLQRYQFNGDKYVPWELNKEAREKIWTFLRIKCGILSI